MLRRHVSHFVGRSHEAGEQSNSEREGEPALEAVGGGNVSNEPEYDSQQAVRGDATKMVTDSSGCLARRRGTGLGQRQYERAAHAGAVQADHPR